MITCFCNDSHCYARFCKSIFGCYKSNRKREISTNFNVIRGCVKNLSEYTTSCFKDIYCCKFDYCNLNSTSINENKLLKDMPVSDTYYLILCLKVIIPILCIIFLVAILGIFLFRKYHDNLTRYLKIYSNFTPASNEQDAPYIKPFIGGNYEENPSRFVNNSSGLLPLNEDLNEKKIVQCDSCTSGSGSGMPFLVQRTIARQVQLVTGIGKGRFGEVWKGTYYGESVAVKIFTSRDEMSWARETHIYNTFLLRHPNILGYYASDVVSIYSCTQLWLITQYHELGSLYDYLHTKVLSLIECVQLLHSTAAGLCHLHTEIVSGPHGKPAIAHRDIKSKNILIMRPGEACVADLGLSVLKSAPPCATSNCAVLPAMAASSKHKVGTRRYMAPEILADCVCTDADSGFEHSPVADTFSCSMVTSSNLALYKQQQSQQLSQQHSQQQQQGCPINFSHFLAADVFALALIMWEVLSRTQLGPTTPGDYNVPFHDRIPVDPSAAEMRQLVCLDRVRPLLPSPAHSPAAPLILAELNDLIRECWADKSLSRPSALRIRKNLKSILMLL